MGYFEEITVRKYSPFSNIAVYMYNALAYSGKF